VFVREQGRNLRAMLRAARGCGNGNAAAATLLQRCCCNTAAKAAAARIITLPLFADAG